MGKRKQPFGYKMKLGEIVPQPQEAEAVRSIYLQYLDKQHEKERSDRHEPLQRQIRTQRSAVLRRVRYGVPQSGVDTAR